MALRDLTDKARRAFEERGGTERLKQDRERLKEIARRESSLSDKARAGLAALREPAEAKPGAGAPEAGPAPAGETSPPAETEPRPDPGAPSTSAEPPGAPPPRL